MHYIKTNIKLLLDLLKFEKDKLLKFKIKTRSSINIDKRVFYSLIHHQYELINQSLIYFTIHQY